MVGEAKARKASGEPTGKDSWTRVLEPKEAIRARVVPVLRDEKERLEKILAEVCSHKRFVSSTILTVGSHRLARGRKRPTH